MTATFNCGHADDQIINLVEAKMRIVNSALEESLLSGLDEYWIECGYEPAYAREITKIMLAHTHIEFRPIGNGE